MYSVGVARSLFAAAGIASLLSIGLPSTALAQGKPFSWTGFYIGAHGGFDWTATEFPGLNAYVAPPAPCGGCGPPRQTISGGIIGGQLGANYQVGGVVFGIEADLSKAMLNGSVRDGNYLVQTDTIDTVGTVRGRLGVAMGRFLPYGPLA